MVAHGLILRPLYFNKLLSGFEKTASTPDFFVASEQYELLELRCSLTVPVKNEMINTFNSITNQEM